jgi:hypothetical protein
MLLGEGRQISGKERENADERENFKKEETCEVFKTSQVFLIIISSAQ